MRNALLVGLLSEYATNRLAGMEDWREMCVYTFGLLSAQIHIAVLSRRPALCGTSGGCTVNPATLVLRKPSFDTA